MLKKFILTYFKYCSKIQLRKNPRATIIGVTGSAGKTSTRLAIVHILKTRGIVKHSIHANSQSGIPLNILGIHPRTYSKVDWLRMILLAPWQLLTNWEHFDYYVVEMGIDSAKEPNNMSYLLQIIRPHVAVVLNASLTHSAGFDHLVKDKSPLRRVKKIITLIAQEKMKLVQTLPKKGVAIINLDQPEFRVELSGVRARQITYGKSLKANLRILSNFRFRYQGVAHKLNLGDIYPEYFAYTFAAAIASCAGLGIPPSQSVKELSTYRAPAGRLRIFSGLSDSTIIDSSYNASPASMLESLKLLKILASKNKKIAVLGDMRELGLSAKLAHKNLADWLLTYCDEAILFGDLTLKHTLPILESQKFTVHHFTHMSDLTKYLCSHLSPRSYVLVKGSQNNILLERAVESILADPSDVARLCRRGPYWDKIRSRIE